MVYVVKQITDVFLTSHVEKICLVQSPTGSASSTQVMDILVSCGCKKVIAVYEALRAEGITQEKAVWYIREYFQRFAAKRVPLFQWAIKTFGLARKFPRLFKSGIEKSCTSSAGFAFEYPESHGNEARLNIVSCPYYEITKKYGCPEITAAYCDSDDAGYGNLHPQLIWGRTKTIGHGGDCCDFLLEYKEN